MSDQAERLTKNSFPCQPGGSLVVDLNLAIECAEELEAERDALQKRVQELSDALEDLHAAIEARADSGKRRALTVSPKMEKSLLKARAALKG